jgi:pantothenate kinase type III
MTYAHKILTLDYGNTHAKAGFFLGRQLLETCLLEDVESVVQKREWAFDEIQAVVCNVREHKPSLEKWEEQGLSVLRVSDWRKSAERFYGVQTDYSSSLGEDRLIVSYFIGKKCTQKTLVIDAGTFLTLDIVAPKHFLGGYILPGLDLTYKNFLQGEKLKDFSPHQEILTDDFLILQTLPHQTPEALLGPFFAVSTLVEKILEVQNISDIVLTGGEAHLIKKFLPLNVSIKRDENLIHESLCEWFCREHALISDYSTQSQRGLS